MTVTLAAFRAEFPEMAQTTDALVQAKLDQAHRAFDADLFGDRYEDAVKLRAAELIAASPYGTDLRIAKGSPETLYTEPLRVLLRSIPATPISIL